MKFQEVRCKPRPALTFWSHHRLCHPLIASTNCLIQVNRSCDRRASQANFRHPSRLRVQPPDMPQPLQYGSLFQAEIKFKQCARVIAKRFGEAQSQRTAGVSAASLVQEHMSRVFSLQWRAEELSNILALAAVVTAAQRDGLNSSCFQRESIRP